MVTIADVARHAGVSSSTVSYVLSGKRAISEETRSRVQSSVRELGYHPNAGARALAARRSHIIALMVPLRTDVYVPVMMEIAIAVTTAARRHGYDVLLITNDEGPDGVRRIGASGLADGLVLMDVELDDERIPVLRAQGTQAALIGLADDARGLSCVDHDFAAAGALCANHLADLGHRDVAFIGYGSGVYHRHAGYAERTIAGFRSQAEERGLRFLHRTCEGTYESTAGTLARVLADRPRTTGFVVQNEGAIGPLLSLLRTSGRTVPEDASVVALCQDQLAEQFAPRLTAVTGSAQDLGRVAVEQIMRRLAAANDGGRPVDDRVLLTPVLTVRDSTGPAPRLP
ncbi:LacI family DNA-binding transcriptional regulator [Lentzea sp. DG1S-22]|uniref:LacI family DNA-binding transcriptional regulator n=1 Tax=unclassified Lentzea TaxID=2643253 RepID=UPI001F3DA444|nr:MULTISPECIES: LacI family DNA-binding transcriptional regulator [unclassified Lentzea]MCG8926353.1 LacI family transcriptional regulator [Lentzea sp. CC55]WVH81605.1 LacI family DNA-binding transcriptional regulator [Lentzea sp. DG1S-22]